MSLLKMVTNVTKAAVAVAASPAAFVADMCMLPDSAMNDRHPFDYTGKMLSAAGKCIAEAVKPENTK